jgi:hypothetical protein
MDKRIMRNVQQSMCRAICRSAETPANETQQRQIGTIRFTLLCDKKA